MLGCSLYLFHSAVGWTNYPGPGGLFSEYPEPPFRVQIYRTLFSICHRSRFRSLGLAESGQIRRDQERERKIQPKKT